MIADSTKLQLGYIRAHGARIVITEADLGMPGAIAMATYLASEMPNSFHISQVLKTFIHRLKVSVP